MERTRTRAVCPRRRARVTRYRAAGRTQAPQALRSAPLPPTRAPRWPRAALIPHPRPVHRRGINPTASTAHTLRCTTPKAHPDKFIAARRLRRRNPPPAPRPPSIA